MKPTVGLPLPSDTAQAPDLSQLAETLSYFRQRVQETTSRGYDQMASVSRAARTPAAPRMAQVRYNPRTNKYVVGGEEFDANDISALQVLAEAGDLPEQQLGPGEQGFSVDDIAERYRNIYNNAEVDTSIESRARGMVENLGSIVPGVAGVFGAQAENPLAGFASDWRRDNLSLREQAGRLHRPTESLVGFANAAGQAIESGVPVLAAGALGSLASPAGGIVAGAAVGGGMAAGSQAEEARARLTAAFAQMSPEQFAQNPEYMALRRAGNGHEATVQELVRRGQTSAARAGGAIGGLSGAIAGPAGRFMARGLPVFGSRFAAGTGDDIGEAMIRRLRGVDAAGNVRRGLAPAARSAGALGALGGIGEGAQEFMETDVAQGLADISAGQAQGYDFGRYGTVDDFVGGFVGGAPFGAIGGLRTPMNRPRPQQEDRGTGDPALDAAAAAVTATPPSGGGNTVDLRGMVPGTPMRRDQPQWQYPGMNPVQAEQWTPGGPADPAYRGDPSRPAPGAYEGDYPGTNGAPTPRDPNEFDYSGYDAPAPGFEPGPVPGATDPMYRGAPAGPAPGAYEGDYPGTNGAPTPRDPNAFDYSGYDAAGFPLGIRDRRAMQQEAAARRFEQSYNNPAALPDLTARDQRDREELSQRRAALTERMAEMDAFVANGGTLPPALVESMRAELADVEQRLAAIPQPAEPGPEYGPEPQPPINRPDPGPTLPDGYDGDYRQDPARPEADPYSTDYPGTNGAPTPRDPDQFDYSGYEASATTPNIRTRRWTQQNQQEATAARSAQAPRLLPDTTAQTQRRVAELQQRKVSVESYLAQAEEARLNRAPPPPARVKYARDELARIDAELATLVPPAPEPNVTTAEPAGDIEAQIDEMLNPESTRDAVWVSKGTPMPKRKLPGVKKVITKVGTLLTTNDALAKQLRDNKALAEDEAFIGSVVKADESKARLAASGEPVVAVQAKTPEGNVAAETLARKSRVPKAAAKVQAQAPDATVSTTSIPAALNDRARRAAPAADQQGGPVTVEIAPGRPPAERLQVVIEELAKLDRKRRAAGKSGAAKIDAEAAPLLALRAQLEAEIATPAPAPKTKTAGRGPGRGELPEGSEAETGRERSGDPASRTPEAETDEVLSAAEDELVAIAREFDSTLDDGAGTEPDLDLTPTAAPAELKVEGADAPVLRAAEMSVEVEGGESQVKPSAILDWYRKRIENLNLLKACLLK